MQLQPLQPQGLSLVVRTAGTVEAARIDVRHVYVYLQQTCHPASLLCDVRLCTICFGR
jgi:hypothetical protein